MTSAPPARRALPHLVRSVVTALVACLGLAVVVGACSGATPPHATPIDTTPGAVNPFVPEDQNLSTCVSSLPRPGCGSKAQGGWHQALTFAVLMLGMAFIGWRIFRSVKHRDQALDASGPDGAPSAAGP